MKPFDEERQVAIDAVVEAARLCRAVQQDLVSAGTLQKDDRSPVTVADFGSQALICRRIRARFPDDPIVGEEDSANLRSPAHSDRLAAVTGFVRQYVPDAAAESVCEWIDAGNGEVAERFWTVDPIDGTKGFLRGDQYAVALALIEDGAVRLGALACPALPQDIESPSHSSVGAVFVAVEGAGAHMGTIDGTDWVRISVQEQDAADRSRFVESVESGHGDAELQAAIAKAAGISEPPLKLDSQVKYGALARGDATLYLRFPSPRQPEYREKIWDHAAGAIIVDEAGGKVTDMHGRSLDFASSHLMRPGAGVIASNGIAHDAVLLALAEPR
jgi:3'(2'), 5'-bisphosphate nucleotidase